MPRYLCAISVVTLSSSWSVFAIDPQGIHFFEKKIRPVLVEKCYSCHSEESKKGPKGGLRVDFAEPLRVGGDSGPAVVPGKPSESLLFKALLGDAEVPAMPPSGKLPESVIKDFERWIRIGAPDPRTGTIVRRAAIDVAAGRSFWAYQPVRPQFGSIDDLVEAKLQVKGITAAPRADRQTLIRRLYFDLVGLPPPPHEIDTFIADTDPLSYERIVDRLLSSAQFGERWGRHWLDVVRFGESVTLRGTILADAWRYRDYVIDAFNDDMPFDQFLREQVAGDILPWSSPAQRRRQLIAATFLTLGNNNYEEQDKQQLHMDVVDEQIDVITKGFLGQTVTCARCHDHKFDPIPQADYYALAGILHNIRTLERANVSVPITVSLPEEPDVAAAIAEHDAKVADLKKQIAAVGKRVPVAPTTGPIATHQVRGIVIDAVKAKKVGPWITSTHAKQYIGDGYVHDDNADKGTKTLTFDPDIPTTGRYEVLLAYPFGRNRSAKVPVVIFSADGEFTTTVDMTQKPQVDERFVSLGAYRFEKDGQSFVVIDTTGTQGHVVADAVVFLPVSDDNSVMPRQTDTVKRLEAELARLQANGPKRQTALGVIEQSTAHDCRIHVRGSVATLGPVVPRGFLTVANSEPTPTFPSHQSGRVELGQWLSSRQNPLTARVFVNRVWHWLFGHGIVRTPDNFGTTGDLPSNPELLDALAWQFMEQGWSVKQLIRSIVLSETYQRSTASSVDADPDNQWFGRANRRRLDAECLRDAILAVAGNLSDERGGKTYPEKLTTDYGYVDTSTRRSVYVPAFRNALPDVFEVFDFADPSVCVGARSTGIIASQALYLLNSPWVATQAQHAARRILEQSFAANDERIRWTYQLILGRSPNPSEMHAVLRHLERHPEGWTHLVHALFASADFRYLD